MNRVSDYNYTGPRIFFLVYKFEHYDAESIKDKIRNCLRNKKIPFSTSSPCCGLSDEYCITSVRSGDVDIETLLHQLPVRLEYGEQSTDDRDQNEYWDCFPKLRHCSICKKTGHKYSQIKMLL